MPEMHVAQWTTKFPTHLVSVSHRKRSMAQLAVGRNLGVDDSNEGFFANNDGTSFEPYSLAWRYLGMYIDCDLDTQKNNGENEASNSNGEDCSRKLLWAAVSTIAGYFKLFI